MSDSLVSSMRPVAVTKVQAAEALSMSIDSLERYVLSDLRVIRRGRLVLIPRVRARALGDRERRTDARGMSTTFHIFGAWSSSEAARWLRVREEGQTPRRRVALLHSSPGCSPRRGAGCRRGSSAPRLTPPSAFPPELEGPIARRYPLLPPHWSAFYGRAPECEHVYATRGTGHSGAASEHEGRSQSSKAYAKATRPRYKKKRWWATGVLLIIIIAAAGGGAGSDDPNTTASEDTSQDSQSEKPAAEEKSAAEEEPRAEEELEMTSGQERARESAETDLDIGEFSKKGLIRQLSSSAGEGFSKADATFAANNVDVDRKKEAVESAKGYLEISPMSKEQLIRQLSSSAGEQFTPAEARYAADKVY